MFEIAEPDVRQGRHAGQVQGLESGTAVHVQRGEVPEASEIEVGQLAVLADLQAGQGRTSGQIQGRKGRPVQPDGLEGRTFAAGELLDPGLDGKLAQPDERIDVQGGERCEAIQFFQIDELLQPGGGLRFSGDGNGRLDRPGLIHGDASVPILVNPPEALLEGLVLEFDKSAGLPELKDLLPAVVAEPDAAGTGDGGILRKVYRQGAFIHGLGLDDADPFAVRPVGQGGIGGGPPEPDRQGPFLRPQVEFLLRDHHPLPVALRDADAARDRSGGDGHVAGTLQRGQVLFAEDMDGAEGALETVAGIGVHAAPGGIRAGGPGPVGHHFDGALDGPALQGQVLLGEPDLRRPRLFLAGQDQRPGQHGEQQTSHLHGVIFLRGTCCQSGVRPPG